MWAASWLALGIATLPTPHPGTVSTPPKGFSAAELCLSQEPCHQRSPEVGPRWPSCALLLADSAEGAAAPTPGGAPGGWIRPRAPWASILPCPAWLSSGAGVRAPVPGQDEAKDARAGLFWGGGFRGLAQAAPLPARLQPATSRDFHVLPRWGWGGAAPGPSASSVAVGQVQAPSRSHPAFGPVLAKLLYPCLYRLLKSIQQNPSHPVCCCHCRQEMGGSGV